MAKVTLDEVKHLGRLARIAISESEAKQMTKELEAILDYVGQLQKVDTTNIEPTSQVTGLEVLNGPLMDLQVPPDTKADILVFDNDFTSHPNYWADNFNAEKRHGSHLSILRKTTADFEVESLSRADQLKPAA